MKKNVILLSLLLASCAPVYADNITLVWHATRPAWEEDWLNELLRDFDITNVDDLTHEIFIDNGIVVMNSGNAKDVEYFKKLRARNYKYGVIVLSDERYDAATDFYEYAEFVFRNYWHKKFAPQKNVHFFPLGYKSGFWRKCSRQVKAAQNREYVWSFAGQLTQKPTRQAMIRSMKRISKYHLHEIFKWADPKSLPVDAYQALLLNTIFVPCPTGWCNLDSFRVYEALECGCIPIVEKKPLDYFSLYFGKHPFLVVDSWDQAPGFINALLANPAQLESYRMVCHQWWLDYKEKSRAEFATVIRNSFKC